MSASLKPLFKYYIENNRGCPIHAALAEYKRKGILIAASGGTGKSTCSRRLPKKREWIPLSDDNALLIQKNGQIMVHPLPTWSDHLWRRAFTTFNTSYFVPVSAIFFLEQADTDEVIPLSKNMAIKKVYESFKQIWETFWVTMGKDTKIAMNKKLFDIAMEIIAMVPCYTLNATLNGKFWKELERVIDLP
jgi:SynChlorMet cassette protein ScmC